jgi:hypothetical protein
MKMIASTDAGVSTHAQERGAARTVVEERHPDRCKRANMSAHIPARGPPLTDLAAGAVEHAQRHGGIGRTWEREPPTSTIRHSVPASRPAVDSISNVCSETPTVLSRARRTSSAGGEPCACVPPGRKHTPSFGAKLSDAIRSMSSRKLCKKEHELWQGLRR